MGYSTLNAITTGNFNTAIGRAAGQGLTSGSNNTMLGYNAQVPSATGSEQIAIRAGGVQWLAGTGNPEGVITADVGSMFARTDGVAGATLYVKEVGTEATGWSVYNPAASNLTLVDEDDMASDSHTSVPSQQSVKAFVENRTEEYTITTILANSSLILGLTPVRGWVPNHISTYLQCKTANNGYAVGDRVPVDTMRPATGGGISVGVNYVKDVGLDTSKLNVRIGAGLFMMNSSAAAEVAVNFAEWDLVVIVAL